VTSSDTGKPGVDIAQRQLFQSIVEVALRVFGAAAASVFVIDRAKGTLVFEAVAGEGEDSLVGTSFPGDTGIAGWVAMSCQPVLVDDVSQSPQFARTSAEATGYIPKSIMAAPLIADGECIGVLEVLDRGSRDHGELSDMDLLGLLATELSAAVELLVRLRWASAYPQGSGHPPGSGYQPGSGDPRVDLLCRVAQRLPGAPEAIATAVTQLLATADQLLAGQG
jgi:GAF domain-containing protein